MFFNREKCGCYLTLSPLLFVILGLFFDALVCTCSDVCAGCVGVIFRWLGSVFVCAFFSRFVVFFPVFCVYPAWIVLFCLYN